MRSRKLRWVIAALALCAGLVVCGRHLVTWLDPLAARQFDTASWAAADFKSRATMARDAIRHLPARLPEAGIVQLLGKADDVVETERLVGSTPGRPLPRFYGSAPAGSVRTYSYFLGSWDL